MSLLKTEFSLHSFKTFHFVINGYASCLKLWNYSRFFIAYKESGLVVLLFVFCVFYSNRFQLFFKIGTFYPCENLS